SYSNNPSRTQMVEWNEDRLLGGAWQFQPPSSSCSRRRRSASPSRGSPKYAPVTTTLPLIQGSTPPSKQGEAPNSGLQVQGSRTRPMALRACALVGSNPRSLSCIRVSMVEVQARGTKGPPPQWPSGPCKSRSRAPQPSEATRDRSAATTSGDSS